MRVLAAAGLLALSGCVEARPFRCATSDQCAIGEARGVCQTGYCAYPDLACESEYRYESNAGDGLAGTCVGVEDEADACDVFCSLWIDMCNEAFPIYPGVEACHDACERWSLEETSPDSLECRRDRLDEALSSEDIDTCVDATPSGGTVCSPDDTATCDTFCERFFSYEACDASDTYESPAACNTACLAFRPTGEGNTIECRAGLLDLVAEALEADQPVDPDWCTQAGPDPAQRPVHRGDVASARPPPRSEPSAPRTPWPPGSSPR